MPSVQERNDESSVSGASAWLVMPLGSAHTCLTVEPAGVSYPAVHSTGTFWEIVAPACCCSVRSTKTSWGSCGRAAKDYTRGKAPPSAVPCNRRESCIVIGFSECALPQPRKSPLT